MAINLTHNSRLYCNNSLLSQALKLLLLKKEIVVTIESTTDTPKTGTSLPAFTHNHFLVYGETTLLEFISEFFPDPRTLPLDPTSRAIHRMLIQTALKDLYPLCDKDHEDLIPTLNESAQALSNHNYFLNNQIYTIDCVLAPVIWRVMSKPGLHPAFITYTHRLRKFFDNKTEEQKVILETNHTEYTQWA